MDWLTLKVLVHHLHFEILTSVESAKLVESKKKLALSMP